MAWYRAGTVSVANGSAVVTGTNTDFVSNTQVGEAFLGPDGRVYEVAQLVSATQIVLGMNYQGGTAGGQGYALMPTSSFARDLALGAAQLLNTFAGVRDGIGAGLFPDGTVAAPGFRFAADQDTGLRRFGANVLSLVTGGVDRVTIGSGGRVRMTTSESDGTAASILTLFGDVAGAAEARMDFGTPAQPYSGSLGIRTLSGSDSEMTGTVNAAVSGTGRFRLYSNAAGAATTRLQLGSAANPNAGAISAVTIGASAGVMIFETSGAECARFDNAGNFLLGSTSGNTHTFRKVASTGSVILAVQHGTGFQVANFNAVDGIGADGANAANASLKLGSAANGRSLAVSGTFNASGADYAEYMRKAEGCGTIAKGDVCGVDRDGFLTRTWAAAVSYVVKSTDPSLVGGDVWAGHLGPKPDPVDAEPIAPGDAPPMPEEDEPEALAAWREAVAAHTALVAAYPAAQAKWASDQEAYETALATWEADLETARQCVDRIAFCGQVPVNVNGDFVVGDYIIAAANGSGIKAIAVAEADITFDQYRRRIGKVWAVRDGRAWIDVQHG